MNIIATTRTRNEEENIEKFCRSYIESGLADQVLVADGGSDDETVAIAVSLPGVRIAEYSGQVFGVSGSNWRNPHGEQMNFVFDGATEEGADWIIFDDCDCTPNHLLQQGGREILESTDKPFVFAVRIYFWGEDEWFPNLSKTKEANWAWLPSLWAWRANIGFRADETDPWRHRFIYKNEDFQLSKGERLDILPPSALLHRSWPTQEKADAKVGFYRAIGQHPKMLHPTKFGGPTEAILEWMED